MKHKCDVCGEQESKYRVTLADDETCEVYDTQRLCEDCARGLYLAEACAGPALKIY